MSKRDRKVAFAEEVDIAEKKQREEDDEDNETGGESAPTRFKEKHSLDSDEEDEKDERQEKGLGDEDLAAQEDSTVTYDDGIKMTPFNLKEEMEEGYFDADGNYFVKDDPNAVEDNWLQDVDWNKVEELQEWNNKQNAQDSADVEGVNDTDKVAIQKQILEILKPGETILKALKRLGGNKDQMASEKWKKKPKKASENKMEEDQLSSDDRKLVVEKLTGLADQLIADGDYSIYDETYEKLKLKLERQEKAKEPLDMFAEASSVVNSSSAAEQGSSEGKGVASSDSSANEVFWEYKWEKDSSDIHGPFSSSQMSDWVENGYFNDGVWVRKTGTQDALFYSSKRIDFTLYS